MRRSYSANLNQRFLNLRGIYAIVNEGPRDPVELARSILLGGARLVQYRAKSGIDERHATALRDLTRTFDALLIVNDDWSAAIRLQADGAHVGPDDLAGNDLARIRNALGNRILGISCGTAEEAQEAEKAGADYIGAGCVFETNSKDDAGDPIGLDGLQRIAQKARLPVAAIGGINADNLKHVRQTGVQMAAVIGAIENAPDARAATEQLVRIWDQRE